MEEKDSLAVYYGKNFWTAPQGAPAQAVPVDWQFTWAGHLCRIPALYVSDAGLTLDVLLFLDSGAVRTFCKKYAGVDGECCFSKRMRKLFRKNEKSVLQFCNKSSKTKRAFTKVLMPCKRPF